MCCHLVCVCAVSVDTVEQMQGCCLLPKRSVDVMQCEVDRMLVLAKQTIVPVLDYFYFHILLLLPLVQVCVVYCWLALISF